mmetsp:Transcript_5513/g.24494  ORF Transcript_5513/g.24494 Transcript_5513/m.24494 type:complete len:227 (-) Transcript_5513:239-919(-)
MLLLIRKMVFFNGINPRPRAPTARHARQKNDRAIAVKRANKQTDAKKNVEAKGGETKQTRDGCDPYAPPPSTSQLGASPPMVSIAGLAAAPGTATWTKNSADWSSSFIVSMYRPLRYFTGMSSTSVRRMPAGSSSASLARTSSGFIRSVSTISIISASELAPRGSAIAVEILGLELYGERVMDTGSDALRHARSSSRRVSRCPMNDSLPSLVNRNRRRWVRRPSGS